MQGTKKQSTADRCIPQVYGLGWLKEQLQLISALVQSSAPSTCWAEPSPAPWGVMLELSPFTPMEKTESSAASPAGRAFASTHPHELCTSLPVGAT